MRARRAGQTGWPVLLAGAAVGVWGWRLELAVLAALVTAQRLTAGRVGEPAAVVMVAGLSGAAVAVGPLRRLAWRSLRTAWVRRAWRRAVTDVGLALDALRAPRVMAVRRIAAGDVLRVRVCRGQSVATLEAPARAVTAARADEPLMGADRGPISDVLTRFLHGYLAGDTGALAYLVAPGTRIVAAAGRLELLSLTSITTAGPAVAGRRSVLVTVHARDVGSRALYMLRYRIALIRRDRWYVARLNEEGAGR